MKILIMMIFIISTIQINAQNTTYCDECPEILWQEAADSEVNSYFNFPMQFEYSTRDCGGYKEFRIAKIYWDDQYSYNESICNIVSIFIRSFLLDQNGALFNGGERVRFIMPSCWEKLENTGSNQVELQECGDYCCVHEYLIAVEGDCDASAQFINEKGIEYCPKEKPECVNCCDPIIK